MVTTAPPDQKSPASRPAMPKAANRNRADPPSRHLGRALRFTQSTGESPNPKSTSNSGDGHHAPLMPRPRRTLGRKFMPAAAMLAIACVVSWVVSYPATSPITSRECYKLSSPAVTGKFWIRRVLAHRDPRRPPAASTDPGPHPRRARSPEALKVAVRKVAAPSLPPSRSGWKGRLTTTSPPSRLRR